MIVHLLTRKIAENFREGGIQLILRKLVAYFVRNMTTDSFDARHGTNTGGFVPLWSLKIQSSNACFGVHYKATDEHELEDVLNSLGENLSTFTFIDLGCGKGRTLLVASRLGFRRVMGVEFALHLVEIARANLSMLKVDNASVLHCDAAELHYPEGPIILYLYNPFSQEVMREVVKNLRKSRIPKLFVIYKNPSTGEAVLDSSGFLTRFGTLIPSSNIQIWRGDNPPAAD